VTEANGGLWCDVPIPVIGVAGEKFTGKTIFVSSIDPQNTLMIDCEKSSASYNIPYKKRVDLYDEMNRLHPNGWKPIDAYKWFVEMIQQIAPGEYTVIAIDPLTDIEQGLADWVYENAALFGKSKTQYDKGGGLFWGDVKSHWKTILGQIAAKCETFAFTAHMKAVFKGGSPTGQRAPKGKETLFEMASLYLLMERKVEKGVYLPPQAKVEKSRVGKLTLDTSVTPPSMSIKECLPPIIINCTPQRIRHYIQNPYDPSKLKRDEKITERVLTDDEKLLIHQEIAAQEAEKVKNEVIRLEMLQVATQRQAQVRKAAEAKAVEAKTPPAATPSTAGSHSHDKLLALKSDLKVPEDQWQAILERRGAKTLSDLSPEQAEEIWKKLWSRHALTGGN